MRYNALCLLLMPGAAWAQAPSQIPAKPSAAAAAPTAPEARRGFQMHIVPFTALSVPFGKATNAQRDTLGGRYSWQWVPLELGLGAKVLDQLYVGAYFNFGIGWEGSDLHTTSRCEAGEGVDDDVSCSSLTAHGGVELRYTFAPAESISGWVGYGIGGTFASQTISDAGRYREVTTAQGIELARLSGGVDFRVKHGIGLGPFALISLGRFVHQRTEIRNSVTFSGAIEDPTIHGWICVGLRLVVYP